MKIHGCESAKSWSTNSVSVVYLLQALLARSEIRRWPSNFPVPVSGTPCTVKYDHMDRTALHVARR
ncbi:hypothetical protein M413DRAFT_105186 [Hebeloma cylindrosporum]|uniref:Uncharacterized protein n=1 Tax=Hebeloma cylindrosporum TaxID=76867 RepID=A0A0C2Z849_HEBCY|nr:hypothetical protein M413DRAFT_105186 [Hebeloma cylindrosporum h7]